MRRHAYILLVAMAWLLAMPRTADAYIGPGAGISVIGTVVAFLSAIVLAIVGFIWYPIKRLLAMMKRKRNAAPDRGMSRS